jgi:hypothetical protein
MKKVPGPSLFIGSMEELERLKFAAAFLKDHCAFKSETGF